MTDTHYDISGGNSQFLPNATHAEQHFHYGSDTAQQEKKHAATVVILGAGVDAVLGLPTSATFIPRIVDFLATDEGQKVDALLRKQLKGLRFRFDKFVSDAIDRIAKYNDKEIARMRHDVEREMETNDRLADNDRKLGRLITLLFGKISDVKQGAAINEEAQTLIEEVLDMAITDDSIIDFSRTSYTDTFKNILVTLLQKSMHEGDNPILRHVYRNLLDIERLLAQYFYGFYSDSLPHIKTYVYIAWVMWAFLVSEEKRVAAEQVAPLPLYAELQGRADCQVISFNYTSFARQSHADSLYFHGSLAEYVDVENKNDFTLDNIATLDLEDFFTHRLPCELSFEASHRALPIPSFLPPLKLKPVISARYITTWYRSAEAIAHAKAIHILGCSLATPDDYFCDMLRPRCPHHHLRPRHRRQTTM